MLQARQLLESNLAEFAAVQVTPNDILKMRRALALEKKELMEGVEECTGDKEFHLYIAEATQNLVLAVAVKIVAMFKFSWKIIRCGKCSILVLIRSVIGKSGWLSMRKY